jgi:hypothetical protein
MDPENIVLSKVEEEIPKVEEEIPKVEEVRLVDVSVVNQNVALNLMVSFLNTAQSRGVFNIEESAKIWECVRFFIIPK